MKRRRRCDWCAVTLTGLRRFFTDKCRVCAPHYRDAGIYGQSGKPPFLHRGRAGLREGETR